jgi:hypothetical protein
MATEELIHKVVDEISFGLISPKDLRKQSVVEIQTPDTYDEDGAPITAGLMDGRLGTLEPGNAANLWQHCNPLSGALWAYMNYRTYRTTLNSPK